MGPEISVLLKYLNPKTFQVISASELTTFAKKMTIASLRNSKHYETLSQFCNEIGLISNHSLDVCSPKNGKAIPQAPMPLAGQASVELYLRQVLKRTHWNLDLGANSFLLKEQRLTWSPRPLFWDVDPKFAEGVQKMYHGFYLNQSELFEAGLKLIRLLPAREVFLKHFGQKDQTQVVYQLEDFQNALDAILDVCLQSKTHLPADFLALGIMMLTLYQNLSPTGLSFDMKSLFDSIKNL